MGLMDPKQAYYAVYAFLDALWERARQPGELSDFCFMIQWIDEQGSRDPAMWYDWLARVNKLQTGVLVPEGTGRRGRLTAEVMEPLDREQAYLAMYDFIEEYWLRVNRPIELGDLLSHLRYTPGAGSADPIMWARWLDAVRKVQSGSPA